jgi:N-acetylglucosamine-6-phosphate deacetylase
MRLLLRGRVVTPLEELEQGWVLVRGDRVAEIGTGPAPSADRVRGGPGHVVAPGLIDLQVNGCGGHDAAEGAESMAAMARHLPASGVTGFLATVITAPIDDLVASCEASRRVPDEGARLLGVHVEGPFLSRAKRGAHDPALLQDPTPEAVSRLARARPRLLTLAPELPGAEEAVATLLAAGVRVSVGHTSADHAQALRGFASGIGFATHLFNAMNPIHHREPGMAGAVLTEPGVTAGLIADGVHVHPAMLRLAIGLKGPDRIALTTDSVAAAGSPPGRYRIGDRDVISDGVTVRLADGDTLAGGASTLDQQIRIVCSFPGVGLRRAVQMASLSSARAIGEEELGRIAPGGPADLVLLDPALEVSLTLRAGESIYEREGLAVG